MWGGLWEGGKPSCKSGGLRGRGCATQNTIGANFLAPTLGRWLSSHEADATSPDPPPTEWPWPPIGVLCHQTRSLAGRMASESLLIFQVQALKSLRCFAWWADGRMASSFGRPCRGDGLCLRGCPSLVGFDLGSICEETDPSHTSPMCQLGRLDRNVCVECA